MHCVGFQRLVSVLFVAVLITPFLDQNFFHHLWLLYQITHLHSDMLAMGSPDPSGLGLVSSELVVELCMRKRKKGKEESRKLSQIFTYATFGRVGRKCGQFCGIE